jgi:hypothetical protein
MKPASKYRLLIALSFCLVALSAPARAVELKQKTTVAFDKYTSATEARLTSELRAGSPFLYVDALPPEAMKSAYEKLKNGEILVDKRETTAPGVSSDIPNGMVHHWVGLIFIPGVTMAQVSLILKDYDHRAELYKPDVAASRLLWRQGDDYRIFLRLYQKRFTTVILNTEYAVHWGQVSADKIYSNSISTRIAEVKNPSRPDGDEWPVGKGRGFLWRLNTYWRLEERDGGVYVQCEFVSLTRDIPFGLGWLLRPLVTSIPRESLNKALGQTRKVVLEKSKR